MADYFLLQSTKDDCITTRGNPNKLLLLYQYTKKLFSERIVKVWNSSPQLKFIFPHWHHSKKIKWTYKALILYGFICVLLCIEIIARPRPIILCFYYVHCGRLTAGPLRCSGGGGSRIFPQVTTQRPVPQTDPAPSYDVCECSCFSPLFSTGSGARCSVPKRITYTVGAF